MENINKSARIIRILELLSSGHRLSTKQIHRHFDGEVTLRTVQRDLITLQEAGIPLELQRGDNKENFWFLPRDYRGMIHPMVHRNELLSVYILKSYLKFFQGTSVSSALDSAIEKLEELAPGEVYSELMDGQSLLWNQDVGQYDYQQYDAILNSMIDCILKKKWVTVSYQGRESKRIKKYDVFPYHLFSYGGAIYAACYQPSHGDFISLAVHRLKEVRSAVKQDRKPPDFDLKAFRKKRFGVFLGDVKKIKLRISPEYASYFQNRSWHASQKIKKQKNGELILEMKVPQSPELIGLILSWHSAIEVLEPHEFRKTIKGYLQETIGLYYNEGGENAR
jgi:predicted DNA-binding transcriptional regulator YafY